MSPKTTLLLVVAAAAFSAEWQLITGGGAGKCEYNGTEISEDEPLRLKNPCEELTCDASTGAVSPRRCDPIRPGPGCSSVTGSGAYPDCCPRTICP